MKVVFFSNFLNDHQLPLCLEFVEQLGLGNFYFVAHQEISQERLDLGFEDMNEKYPFVVNSYKGGPEQEFAQRLMIDADVVIIGSYINMPFEKRMKLNKLTFRYNERILKQGDVHWLDPRLHYGVFKSWTRYTFKNLYTLCASAYTARDLSLFGYPKRKCLKWGYFPVVVNYDNVDEILQLKDNNCISPSVPTIVWVGRLIDWKHPDDAIKLASLLKHNGHTFNLDIIGIGPMESTLKQMIIDLQLEDNVHLLGAMPPHQVRKHMETSQIFLFTSDRNEGWGAVLNEAMNSACAVVANREIGSVPFLLKDGYNGFIYDSTLASAYKAVTKLIADKQLIKQLGRQAYYSITEQWCAKNAVQRFLTVCNSHNCGMGIIPYNNDVCSIV